MSLLFSPASTSLPDLLNLPFLLRLIDDDSPVVRQKIAAQLRGLGVTVWPEIERRQIQLTAEQRYLLEQILDTREEIPTPWLDWLHCERPTEQLEAAFAWLSGHRHQRLMPSAELQLREALDNLAREYLETGGAPDPEELSAFLFQQKAIGGAFGDQYYLPENSDLLDVLQNRCGLPLSLVSIFMLVGARLDIEIFGCDFPGHFMARASLGSDDEADLIFDCHDDGRVLQPSEVHALRKTAPMMLSTPASTKDIIARVLRNYATAHHVHSQRSETLFYLNLLHQLEATNNPFATD